MADSLPWWRDPVPDRALDKYLQMRGSEYFRHSMATAKKSIPRPSHEQARALDYGCGGGELTVYLAKLGYAVTACDSSTASLGACREHVRIEGIGPSVEFIHNEAPDYWKGLHSSFDLIVAKDVIEHIREDEAFVHAASAHLRKCGVLVLITQNNCSWNYHLEAPKMRALDPHWCGWHPEEHIRFYNKPTLCRLLNSAGLKPVAWRAVYLIPYRAFTGYLARKLRNAVDKAFGEGAFYWPERLVGSLPPFHGWGWSIQVKAVKS